MYNKWISNTSNNEEFMFANLALKNIEFALISIEHIFNAHFNYKVYKDDYTYYFYYLQNLLDACGNIADVFNNSNNIGVVFKNTLRSPRQRSQNLCKVFGINKKEFPLIFTKEARNTNTHSNERYEENNFNIGDYNIIDEYTPDSIKHAIINTAHLRTYDRSTHTYITRDRYGNTIMFPLKQLQQELMDMKNRIETNEVYVRAWRDVNK